MKTTTKICILVPVIVLIGPVIFIGVLAITDWKLNKVHDYRIVERDCGCGVLGGRLTGSYRTRAHESVLGPPYELLIWFHTPDSAGTVTLRSVELRDADKRDHFYAEMDDRTESLKRDNRGGYTAYFHLKSLDLPYVRYALIVRLAVDNGEKIERRDIELLFEKDYKEYWSNGFWSALMGI